jgi:hypothetical protein
VLGLVLDVGDGVVKSERGQDDVDDNEKVVEVLSNGGVEKEVDEDVGVAGVNVNEEGGGWENVVTPIPIAEVVEIEPHEFLLPFLFF